MLAEFEKFIKASASGRRKTASGKRIASGTLKQYWSVFKLISKFEESQKSPLRILVQHKSSGRALEKERRYWEKFHRNFSRFLYIERKCFGQYVSSVFKIIRTFFNYLLIDKGLPIGFYHKKFRAPRDHFDPVALSPAQLRILINENRSTILKPPLQRARDIFIIGCTVGLRFQDLMRLKRSNIQSTPEGVFLQLVTCKTGVGVRIPLPKYALEILDRYKNNQRCFLLPRLSKTNLNRHIKRIINSMGWDYSWPKIRTRMGKAVEIKRPGGSSYRFCDHTSSHTMRRTAITTLLMLDVPENIVRMVSGHSPGSREFYRYVGLAQGWMDEKLRQAQIDLLQGNTSPKISKLEN